MGASIIISLIIGLGTLIFIGVKDPKSEKIKYDNKYKYPYWIAGIVPTIIGILLFFYTITDTYYDLFMLVLVFGGLVGIHFFMKKIYGYLTQKHYGITFGLFIIHMAIILLGILYVSRFSMITFPLGAAGGYVGVLIRTVVDLYEKDKYKKGALLFITFFVILAGGVYLEAYTDVNKTKPKVYLEQYISENRKDISEDYVVYTRLRDNKKSIFEMASNPVVLRVFSSGGQAQFEYYKEVITEIKE